MRRKVFESLDCSNLRVRVGKPGEPPKSERKRPDKDESVRIAAEAACANEENIDDPALSPGRTASFRPLLNFGILAVFSFWRKSAPRCLLFCWPEAYPASSRASYLDTPQSSHCSSETRFLTSGPRSAARSESFKHTVLFSPSRIEICLA